MSAGTAKRIDGNDISDRIMAEARGELNAMDRDRSPLLTSILVGENPPARAYMDQQARAAENTGIRYRDLFLPGDMSEEALLTQIRDLNEDEDVDGILLQVPTPEQIDTKTVQQAISWDKDVEGVHPTNMGNLVFGRYRIAPCTALATRRVLDEIDMDVEGKEVTVIGHSEIVGKPIALMLLSYPATTTVCHIATRDLTRHTRDADIVITAVGEPGFLTGDMLKEGAVIIDIGISAVMEEDEEGNPITDDKGNPQKTLVGDLDVESARDKAAWITPVPGGVGPITVAMLMKNTVTCAQMHAENGAGDSFL